MGLLHEIRNNVTLDWKENLPDMAERLENLLYQQAESITEYSNPRTLLKRLRLTLLGEDVDKQSNSPLCSWTDCELEGILSLSVSLTLSLSLSLTHTHTQSKSLSLSLSLSFQA
jgi:hypothetical protein